MFRFDPAPYRATYEEQGWVHVSEGADPEFLEHLRTEAARGGAGGDATGTALRGAGIRGAKSQFLYEPHPDLDLRAELGGMTAAMCGLVPASFTVSERHIKAYEVGADPDPPAHKDRLSSLVSVGVSIVVPEGSTLVLYPHNDVGENPYLTTDLRASLEPDALPEDILAGVRGIEIQDRPGDVIVFRGSAFWHRRLRSRGTVNLYLKCNDFDSDPLGEDPTSMQRAAGTSALVEGGDPLPDDVVPTLRRDVEWVGTLVGRDGASRPFAKRWERPPQLLDPERHAALVAVDGLHTWGQLRRDCGIDHKDLAWLAGRGLIDLVPQS
ncbi:MAG TPA: hypothetical protein VHY81_05290 [Acidimicrobiales bacterium]|nr:hypothetical protein [Acidimicrobiales bacterium]